MATRGEIFRRWLLILKYIPYRTNDKDTNDKGTNDKEGITTSELLEKLRNVLHYLPDDETPHRKALQRDLKSLSSILPLKCDPPLDDKNSEDEDVDKTSDDQGQKTGYQRGKKRHWYWDTEETLITSGNYLVNPDEKGLPLLDLYTAFALKVAQQSLEQILPSGIANKLNPHLAEADTILQRVSGATDATQIKLVRILSRNQPLPRPAELDNSILEVIIQGLLLGRCITGVYKSRSSGHQQKSYSKIHPLGLVIIDQVIYLVCTLMDQQKAVYLPLHRFIDASLLKEKVARPHQFDLDSYIEEQGHFGFLIDDQKVDLKAYFEKWSALHLQETELYGNMTLDEDESPSERVLLRAEFKNTYQLRWWLLGFGGDVEIVEPPFIREYFREHSNKMNAMYNPIPLFTHIVNSIRAEMGEGWLFNFAQWRNWHQFYKKRWAAGMTHKLILHYEFAFSLQDYLQPTEEDYILQFMFHVEHDQRHRFVALFEEQYYPLLQDAYQQRGITYDNSGELIAIACKTYRLPRTLFGIEQTFLKAIREFAFLTESVDKALEAFLLFSDPHDIGTQPHSNDE